MRGAMDLLYNTTGTVSCYDTSTTTGPAAPGDEWLYMWCTVVRAPLEESRGCQSSIPDCNSGIRGC